MVTLTGEDTIIIGARILSDFGDGDTASLDFPNDDVVLKKGKGGNTIYALNAQGGVGTIKIRLLQGSEDDKSLNSERVRYLNDPPSYTFLDCEFIKRGGDGQGNVINTVYQMSGAIPKKMPIAKENVEGDTEQAIVEWELMFPNSNRSIS